MGAPLYVIRADLFITAATTTSLQTHELLIRRLMGGVPTQHANAFKLDQHVHSDTEHKAVVFNNYPTLWSRFPLVVRLNLKLFSKGQNKGRVISKVRYKSLSCSIYVLSLLQVGVIRDWVKSACKWHTISFLIATCEVRHAYLNLYPLITPGRSAQFGIRQLIKYIYIYEKNIFYFAGVEHVAGRTLIDTE